MTGISGLLILFSPIKQGENELIVGNSYTIGGVEYDGCIIRNHPLEAKLRFAECVGRKRKSWNILLVVVRSSRRKNAHRGAVGEDLGGQARRCGVLVGIQFVCLELVHDGFGRATAQVAV